MYLLYKIRLVSSIRIYADVIDIVTYMTATKDLKETDEQIFSDVLYITHA